MYSIFYLLIFIFGLSVGSFLNCLIYRLEKEESFLRGRSYCPSCHHQLAWSDLIPLVSFLLLKRKCRYCRQKISWQYPLVELITGLFFVIILWYLSFSFNIFSGFWFFQLVYYLIIVSLLIIIFVYDLRHYVIPDKIIYIAIGTAGLWYLAAGLLLNFYNKYEILNAIYSAIGAAAFFLLIVLVSRGRWMGAGDIKLAFLLGLILGYPAILISLFLAFFFGAIIGIGLIILGKKTLKSEVPFGPFLISGFALTFFFGQTLINWYLTGLQ
jgi:prepilin signal peptidase PulO-like enzyme (type II secretory pathway)